MNNEMVRLKDRYGFPNAPDHSIAINRILADKFNKLNSAQKEKPTIPKSSKYIMVDYKEGSRVEEIKELVVHEFNVSDESDPDLYAAQPLLEWEESDTGQWILRNAAEPPSWHRIADMSVYGYRYQIRARFFGPALTEYLLRKSK